MSSTVVIPVRLMMSIIAMISHLFLSQGSIFRGHALCGCGEYSQKL